MRFLCLVALASPLLIAQDAREIVRRAVELDKANEDNWRAYTYRERQVNVQLDGAGNIKSQSLRTFEVTNVEGSPYRRLVARNDQPLSPEEQKAEGDKLQWNIAQRRKETKEQRDRRIAEWQRRQQRQREPLAEVPDAFNFRIAGEEKVGGVDAWVIDGEPKPGYRAKSSTGSVLSKMRARFWIAKSDSHWVKMDAETIDSFTYMVLLRIAKGAHITMEQARLPDGVWLPNRIALNASASVAFGLKRIRTRMDFTYSDYRRPGAGAAAMAAAGK